MTNELLLIILLAVGFLSFVPVISVYKGRSERKYRCLKYLIYTTFVWTILLFVERFSTISTVMYYTHLLGYPLKFLLASFMMCTIFNYVEKEMPKFIMLGLAILFLLDLGVALSNETTQYMVKIIIDDVVNITNMYNADKGILFIYHLIATYIVLFIGIIYLYYFLGKNKEIRQYRSVSRTMTYSILFVLFINMMQLVIGNVMVDLTYVSLVVVVYALYRVIYSQDMIFNLKTSGRGEILSNMREMYIITDHEHRIVEISPLLEEKYSISSRDFESKKLETLIQHLEQKIVFFSEYDVDSTINAEKDHFHLREKKFVLKGMNTFGYMYLLYDETKVYQLLRELNKLSNYDSMTGLHNRNYIERILEEYKPKENTGVISLDLNGLKINNDYLGHERGDYLLKKLANNIKESTRKHSNFITSRIGGDEFLVVLFNTTKETIKDVSQSILSLCEDKNIENKISVSVGCDFDPNGEKSIYEIIKNADENMYEMKRKVSQEYRNQVIEYTKREGKYIR